MATASRWPLWWRPDLKRLYHKPCFLLFPRCVTTLDIQSGWLAQLKDMAVADFMTPDLELADAGHHAECREQLQQVLKTFSIALCLHNLQMTCSASLAVSLGCLNIFIFIKRCPDIWLCMVQKLSMKYLSFRSRFLYPAPKKSMTPEIFSPHGLDRAAHQRINERASCLNGQNIQGIPATGAWGSRRNVP